MPDTKNYHTWAYLNWLYSHFSNLPESQGGNRITEQAWSDEVEWCNNMLDSNFKFRGSSAAGLNEEAQPESEGKIVPLDEETEEEGPVVGRGDGRNNSAWSWRWHLMIARKGAKPKLDAERE
jgi:protein farnesyltransferase/geranylgeranyltransferase type-1 subunit alpha